jgi:hypothetical protein
MTEEKNRVTGETKTYTYNSENQLVAYEHKPDEVSGVDTTASYKYDLHGRRIQKAVNGDVTNFCWEGDNLGYEMDSTNQVLRKYVYSENMDDVLGTWSIAR